MSKILITGATGNTGSLITGLLKERGVDVRALVRDDRKAASLRQQGVEVVRGDLDDPTSLADAMAGVDKIYLVTWNGPTGEQQRKNVVDAAKRTGEPHVIVGGALGPPSRIIEQIDGANEYLKDSGLPWTILQPTFFMQNVMAATATIGQGQLYWDLGDGRLPAIDVRDIADCAVSVLTSEDHEGRSYDLTGPEAISFHDMAGVLSQELGHGVSYIPVPTAAAKVFLLSLGFPEWTADGFGELMAGFASNWAADKTTKNVEMLAGHPARPFAQFVHDSRDYFLSGAALAQVG
jgi:uncharacterized protein YbjT (DUF2867 family)